MPGKRPQISAAWRAQVARMPRAELEKRYFYEAVENRNRLEDVMLVLQKNLLLLQAIQTRLVFGWDTKVPGEVEDEQGCGKGLSYGVTSGC